MNQREPIINIASLSNITDHTQILDNDAAEFLLGEAGILYAVNQHPLSKPFLWLAANDESPAVFLVGMSFWGFENSAENGFVVHAFPKSKFNRTDIEKFCAATMRGFSAENEEFTLRWMPSLKA